MHNKRAVHVGDLNFTAALAGFGDVSIFQQN